MKLHDAGSFLPSATQMRSTSESGLRGRGSLGSGNRPLASRHSPDAQVRAEYLEGHYLRNRRTAADIRQAVAHFGRAIEVDPGYALARATLADAGAVMAFNDQAPPADSENRARQTARRALELDDGLAEGYAT